LNHILQSFLIESYIYIYIYIYIYNFDVYKDCHISPRLELTKNII